MRQKNAGARQTYDGHYELDHRTRRQVADVSADDAEQAMNRGYTSRASFPSPGRPAPEDSFDVVTVRIEHEGGVVACRIAHCGVP